MPPQMKWRLGVVSRARWKWAFAATWFVAACQATAASLSGVVVGVADGDTLTLLDARLRQHQVRLSGIDAPEKRQPFGQRSKHSLSLLVYGRSVRVEAGKADRYDRLVGKVIVDGVDVNREQVRRGFAWHYVAYAREQSREDRERYADAERSARAERRGLWALPHPVPPWDFRRSGRGLTVEQPVRR